MNETEQGLVNLLKSKSILKQNVYHNNVKWFKVFKEELNDCVAMLSKDLDNNADNIRLKIVDRSDTEVQLYIGSDVLIFQMHTNVFKIANDNYVHQSSYIKKNPDNAYCGIINIYNFLADSYQFNRSNDYGYLISRIFVNREDHFFIEGKGELEFMYKDFLNQVLNKEVIIDVIMKVATFAVDFDLITPPYNKVSVVSVNEMQTISSNSKLKTGKRLGFKFQADNDVV